MRCLCAVNRRLPISADRHEAYYKSTCDQTVVDPETKAHFPFVKDELIHVEVSHKVWRTFLLAFRLLLHLSIVLRERRIHVVRRRKPSSSPPLDRQLVAVFPLASRTSAVLLPPPQDAIVIGFKDGRTFAFLASYCGGVARHVGCVGFRHASDDPSVYAVRETHRPQAYLLVLLRTHPCFLVHSLVEAAAGTRYRACRVQGTSYSLFLTFAGYMR